MDLFRWKRTLVRALAPATACALLAGWGVYALTADERPEYRSFALLNTGIMSNRDQSKTFNRDLVINELENLTNLARSFEVREELSARLLAHYLSLRGRPRPSSISARAHADFAAELDAGILRRHGRFGGDEDLVYASIVAQRDSLRAYGEAAAEHPLIELLYGENELVGAEQLATLKVNRKGMSDLLELSYATVDAAWCKLTLDRHLDIFLRLHREVKEQQRSGALAYFRKATADSRANLDDAEERLRRFATDNKIINYYEQTRFISGQKNQVDHRYTEEAMQQAAADSTLARLEQELSRRVDLVRISRSIEGTRRRIGELSREQLRLELMAADSISRGGTREGSASELPGADEQDIAAGAADAAREARAASRELAALKRQLSDDVLALQQVHSGPEGLELGRLLSEWIAATINREVSAGRIAVLDARRVDFNRVYQRMANLGARMKKIERETRIYEEDYIENLRSLNEALQKEFSQGGRADLRLVDAPVLPAKPEKSKRLIFVAVGFLGGGAFPLALALALELLSGALLSFAEAERRTGLSVVGGLARWSRVRRLLQGRHRGAVDTVAGDLLWQGVRSRGTLREDGASRGGGGPALLAFSSLRPGAGKSHALVTFAERLATRRLRVLAVADHPLPRLPRELPERPFDTVLVDPVAAMAPGVTPRALTGLAAAAYDGYDIVLWELPALATGRLPVDVARSCGGALLVHPAAEGWSDGDASALQQLRDALGREPQLLLNALALDVLLHEWGTTLRRLRAWAAPSAPKATFASTPASVSSVSTVSSDEDEPRTFTTPAQPVFAEAEAPLGEGAMSPVFAEANPVSLRTSAPEPQTDLASCPTPAGDAAAYRLPTALPVEASAHAADEADSEEREDEPEAAPAAPAAPPALDWEHALRPPDGLDVWSLPEEPTTPPRFPASGPTEVLAEAEDWEGDLRHGGAADEQPVVRRRDEREAWESGLCGGPDTQDAG